MIYKSILDINVEIHKGRTMHKLQCPTCSNIFERMNKAIKYALNQGQSFMCCSKSCSGKHRSNLHAEHSTVECPGCQEKFVKPEPTSVYCSISCSNSMRTHTSETKIKISNSLSKVNSNKDKQYKDVDFIVTHYQKTNRVYRKDISHENYSPLRWYTCMECDKLQIGRNHKKYCSDCSNMYSQNGRFKFRFTFNVYDYPELFDLNSLNDIGWKSPRGDMTNPNGYTRDHKVSVYDALKFNYDPYYISHVMNCELMRMYDNCSKNRSSSITYDELVKLVDEFDSKN